MFSGTNQRADFFVNLASQDAGVHSVHSCTQVFLDEFRLNKVDLTKIVGQKTNT